MAAPEYSKHPPPASSHHSGCMTPERPPRSCESPAQASRTRSPDPAPSQKRTESGPSLRPAASSSPASPTPPRQTNQTKNFHPAEPAYPAEPPAPPPACRHPEESYIPPAPTPRSCSNHSADHRSSRRPPCVPCLLSSVPNQALRSQHTSTAAPTHALACHLSPCAAPPACHR